MFSYATYKVVHLAGVMMVLLALGGVATHAIDGGARNHAWRRPLGATHGIGLLLSLVGGFGLLARLGFVHSGIPGWALAKLGIWVVLAGLIGVLVRKPAWARPAWLIIVLLGAAATHLAGSKPF